jgi:hypothetical protein
VGMETCGTCKHWEREPEWDSDSDAMVLPRFGKCQAIPDGLGAPWCYAPCDAIDAMKAKQLAYIGYEVATLETQASFGCVLHEPLPLSE